MEIIMAVGGITNLMAAVVFGVFILLIVCAVAAVIMLISLSRQGDERRKTILQRTCVNTFYITVGFLVLYVIAGLIRSIAFNQALLGINPAVGLGVIAVVYTINLVYFKVKYGG